MEDLNASWQDTVLRLLPVIYPVHTILQTKATWKLKTTSVLLQNRGLCVLTVNSQALWFGKL